MADYRRRHLHDLPTNRQGGVGGPGGVFRTHCPREDQAAPPPLGEFRAEMVGDVQMRHRTEPQSRLKQLAIKLQELAGISGAGIGDDKADVEIGSGGGELPDEILPRDIKHDDSMLHPVTLAKFSARLLKQILPPRNKDNVDSRGRDLPRELSPYAGRGA